MGENVNKNLDVEMVATSKNENQILDETSSANLSKIADESLDTNSSQSDEFANKNQSATNTSKFGQNLKGRLKLNRPLSLNTKRKLAKDAMTISLGVLVATAFMKRTKVVKSIHLISGVLLVGASYYHHTLYQKNYKEKIPPKFGQNFLNFRSNQKTFKKIFFFSFKKKKKKTLDFAFI